MFYTYNRDFIHIGQTQGQTNPKTGQAMKPANSTTIAPPVITVEQLAKFIPESNSWGTIESPFKIAKDAENLLLLESKNDLGVLLYELVDGVAVARSAITIGEESAAASIQNQIVAARDAMDISVLTKAMEVTSTTGSTSAQASVTAFQWRATNAGSYVDAGLVVRYASGSFVKDAALDNEADIVAYYNAVLIELDLFREAAIATYITQKTALEAI